MALTGLLKGLLFQVTTTDPETYAAVSALLLIAALAACWAPARRAARINPQEALRCE
jgi:ABC-type lipoprotein release transport system permease subunit